MQLGRFTASSRAGVQYQPEESPPTATALAFGVQLAALNVAAIVLIPTIVVRAAGGTEAYLYWAVFVAVAVAGAITVLQAVRVGRFGAGYLLLTGPSAAFIAVSVTAIEAGGPAMLATLILISSLFQFLLSVRFSTFRRVLTPSIAGTVIMLVPVSVMPALFDLMKQVPKGLPAMAVPMSALATVLVFAGISLKATGVMRVGAPIVGVVAGSAVAGYFGLFDMNRVAEAAWVGLPGGSGWPGFDLNFGLTFWTLLPAFLLLTLVGSMETLGASAAVQSVSRRRRRAVDLRVLQGAVAADGTGNLLSGLAGTVPIGTYGSSVPLTDVTGVAARSVGIVAGAVFIVVAFVPKALAIALAIPGPVVATYVAVLMAILFLHGMRMVVQHGSDHRSSLVCGAAFWVGVSVQYGWIFPESVSQFAGGIVRNGVLAGGLTAIILTLFVVFAGARRRRMQTELDLSVLPRLRKFVNAFASRSGWDEAMANRLEAVIEETLLSLLPQDGATEQHDSRQRLVLLVHKEHGGAVLELILGTGRENLEDRIAVIAEQAVEVPIDKEVSLRLLRHFASSVRHQQYHDINVVTVRVDASRPNRLDGA